jgi:hypothetical protein
MRGLILIAGAAALAGCNQPANDAAANQAAAIATAKKPKPAHCFFKDSETKGWTAKRGKDGNIIVTGKAYRSDPRYKALLNPATVTGTSAEIAPTIGQNDTGFAAPENWWDVSASIPASSAVDTVTVRCGAKALAELKVPAKG